MMSKVAFKILQCYLCWYLSATTAIYLPPKFVISSIHGISLQGQSEKDLVKSEGLAFLNQIITHDHKNGSSCKLLSRNNESDPYGANKLSTKKFINDLNDELSKKNNCSVLFFIPDINLDLDEIFIESYELQRKMENTIVIPCLYTKSDALHFAVSRNINDRNDDNCVPSKRKLSSSITSIINGINHPINVIAHGFGARALSRFNELNIPHTTKTWTTNNKPLFTNLFLAAPALESDFFVNPENRNHPPQKLDETNLLLKNDKGIVPITTSAKRIYSWSNEKAGKSAMEAFSNIHIFYDQQDRVLEPGGGLLGQFGPLKNDKTTILDDEGEKKISKLNCNPYSFWVDPLQHHNYHYSTGCIDYMKDKLGYTKTPTEHQMAVRVSDIAHVLESTEATLFE